MFQASLQGLFPPPPAQQKKTLFFKKLQETLKGKPGLDAEV